MIFVETLNGLSHKGEHLRMGVSHGEQHGVVSIIERQPPNFQEPIWLHADNLDPELTKMLQRGSRKLDATRLGELDEWFGKDGKFPAVSISTGKEDRF